MPSQGFHKSLTIGFPHQMLPFHVTAYTLESLRSYGVPIHISSSHRIELDVVDSFSKVQNYFGCHAVAPVI